MADADIRVGGRPRTRTRKARTRAGFGLVAIVAAVSLVASCAKDNAAGPAAPPAATNVLENEGTPQDGGKLVMAVTAETNGWNPATSQWAEAGNFVGSSVIEPLMEFDEKGSVQPWLADSVEPKTAGDFTKWVIKVKPNIRFHNGQPLNAAAVKDNLDLVASPGSLAGVALKSVFRSITAVDDLTVEVDLNLKWAAYPANLAGPNGLMMAPEQIEAPDGGKSHPIGTGPFKFASWTPDVSFRAVKNPDYWRKGEPHLDEIEFRPITDEPARVAALQAGDVDMILTRQADDVQALRDSYTSILDYDSEKAFVMLQTAQDPNKPKNPFTNIHARRALAYGTDRKTIAASQGEGIKSSTSPFVLNTQWEQDDAQTGYYPYDLQKAKDEIDAYKKETGESDFTFTLTGIASPDELQLLQLLVAQWKDLGINATIDTHAQTDLIQQLVFGNYQAIVTRSYGYIDPDFDFVFWHSSQAAGIGVLSINFQQLKDDALDKAMEGARQIQDDTKRKAFYLTAAQRLNDQAVNIWLFNTPFAIITAPAIKGLNPLRTHRWGNYLPHPWMWGSVWRQGS
jgi:peptide/nickel transport system substrate-binding protein